MKKILLLGGTRYLIPVIKAAHELGLYVITCDYLPDNIAHKYSDEYKNISIIEKEKVLEYAQEAEIDGIISFACDPGVVTAAYVAEKMNLPFQTSYEAAKILQDKGLFRKFLTDNGFNVPHSKRYTDKCEAYNDIDFFTWPVIVKPVDSAGSRGVTRVNDVADLAAAIDCAMNASFCGAYIIEDFLTFAGFHSSTDPFSIDGVLKFVTYSDQLFDPEADNPYTPATIIWPTTMEMKHQKTLTSEIQRLITLLNIGTGIYNIETCVGINGKPYIMEVSPRGGGCDIAELQRLAYGVNLIKNEVAKAVGLPLDNIQQTECDGYWCEMVIHAKPNESGVLKEITIDPIIRNKYVKFFDVSAKPGEIVKPFAGANNALGDVILRFNSREELDEVMACSKEWMNIILE